ncbi:MAG: GGDEF domain-containing protein, partial [Desulfuromonadales bacterium]|nr:GGDEF domain-containing protein [Desulfuromonadales bacterium]
FLASAAFGVPGGVLAAAVAGCVLGPFMPLDTISGTPQTTISWIFRTVFFMLTGFISGCLFSWLNAHLDRIQTQALIDPQTGLPNLQALRENLTRAYFCDICFEGSPLLAIIDIANVREIIDTVGYQCAQALVPQILERIETIKDPSLSIYRLPAERFAVLARDIELDQFTSRCNQVFSWFEKPFYLEDIPVMLNVYIGIAQPAIAASADELIQKASVAAHIAATKGLLYSAYSEENVANSVKTLALLGALNDAINSDELELYYQPKINIATKQVECAEALIRWMHPTEGLVLPDSYIPQAEKTWLVHPLSLFAVKEVLKQLRKWQRKGLNLKLAVNLTTHNIQNLDFIAEVVEMLRVCDINVCDLEIEITERSVLTDVDTATDVLGSLKQMGATITLDDFGAGYSSIGLLGQLPVDVIKIDQRYIKNLMTSDFSQAVVKRIIQTAKDIHLHVVAEGVESEEILEKLKELGCDSAQGFYISPPLPKDDFAAWLEKSPWTRR